MRQKHFTVLILLMFMFPPLVVNAMEFQTSDGKIIAVHEELTKVLFDNLITVKLMYEDIPRGTGIPLIPILTIHSDVLRNILGVLEAIKGEEDKREQEVNAKEYVSAIDCDGILINLIMAANFLDFGVLMNALIFEFLDRLNISEIDSQEEITEMKELFKLVSEDVKKQLIVHFLPDFRHYLEICILINTSKFKIDQIRDLFYDFSSSTTNFVTFVSGGPRIWSPLNGYIVARDAYTHKIGIYTVKDTTLIKTIENATDNTEFAFTKNDNLIILYPESKTVEIWNQETNLTITLDGNVNGISSIAWSENEKFIVLVSDVTENKIRIFDSKTGKLVKHFIGDYEAETAIFDLDGKFIIFVYYPSINERKLEKLTLFDDKTWEMLTKIVTKDEDGNPIIQVTFAQGLELIAAMNANKKGLPFLFKEIIDQKLIDLINQCFVFQMNS